MTELCFISCLWTFFNKKKLKAVFPDYLINKIEEGEREFNEKILKNYKFHYSKYVEKIEINFNRKMAEAERDDKFVEKKKVEETEWNERQEGSLVFRQKTATKMVKVTNADLYIRFLKVKGKRALTQQLEKKQIESKVSESKERTRSYV